VNFILYLFLAIGLVQILYWLYYLIGVILLRPIKQGPSIPKEGVSVVVAAKNELENLKVLIPAILNQEYPNFELIIVNDRSSDGTLEYIYELSQVHDNLEVRNVDDLPDHINGKKFALTLGIKAAQNDQVLFTDADCLPSSTDWIAAMSQGFSEKNAIVLGFSNYVHHSGFLNYFIRFETHLTGIEYLAAARLGAPYMGVGRNLCYKNFLSDDIFSTYLF
jgi:glycosyltransferase involved in cell wall biosynthesis